MLTSQLLACVNGSVLAGQVTAGMVALPESPRLASDYLRVTPGITSSEVPRVRK